MINYPGEDLKMEFLESRERSFNGLWGISDDYVIEEGLIKAIMDGEVCEVGYSRKEYIPMGRPELPGEFAKLADGSEEQALEFIRRYGLLRGSIPVSFKKESNTTWSEDVPRGNPLTWVVSHAKAVKLVMDLSGLLDQPAKLKEKIQDLTRTLPGMDEPFISFLIPRKDFKAPFNSQWFELEPKAAALNIISIILNQNLKGVSRYLQVENQKLVSLFTTTDLLDCIYWMLADAVVSGRVKTCNHCGRPFVAENEKRKFCPPVYGSNGVSLCMNRAKQKEFRKPKEPRE